MIDRLVRRGRPNGSILIPLTLIPLWGPALAAAGSARARAEGGSHAIAFSEKPVPELGLPQLHTVSGIRWGFAMPGDLQVRETWHVGSSSNIAHHRPLLRPRPVQHALHLQRLAVRGDRLIQCSGHAWPRFPRHRILAQARGMLGLDPVRARALALRIGSTSRSTPGRGPNRSPSSSRTAELLLSGPRGSVSSREPVRTAVAVSTSAWTNHVFETELPARDSDVAALRSRSLRLINRCPAREHEAWKFPAGNAIALLRLDRYRQSPSDGAGRPVVGNDEGVDGYGVPERGQS